MIWQEYPGKIFFWDFLKFESGIPGNHCMGRPEYLWFPVAHGSGAFRREIGNHAPEWMYRLIIYNPVALY